MRKTTTFFVLVASILIQLTAARKEHVICQDVLQTPNIIASDGRKGYDTDILQEIRIRTNLTTDSCNAELQLHYPGQEMVNDPNKISTSRTVHNSRQSKTRIHTDETWIVGNNMAANNRRRTDKRMASALRVRNIALQKGKKFRLFVTKDIHANQDGKYSRRDVQFYESRRRLNDEYRRLSTDDYRRIFIDRKKRRDSKINSLLSDTRRDETAIDSRRREHFTRGDVRQNISRQHRHVTNYRKEDSILSRSSARRKEDLRDDKSGSEFLSGFNVVRHFARMEVHSRNPITRDPTDGENMNRIIGETRNVAHNNENFLRARRRVDSMREGEVTGTNARRVDRRNRRERFSKKLIRNNGYNGSFGNGNEPMRTSDGRVTNLYRHYTGMQRHMKEKNIRAARENDSSVSTRSRRTTKGRNMDREVRERRAVKSTIREHREKLHLLRTIRASEEKRHCGITLVKCIETKAISVLVNEPEERMVRMKQDHQRNFILQSGRDDKNTCVQKHRYSSYIRQGNYNEQRTDTINAMGINRGRRHERAAHIEDIARALTITPGGLSIIRDQRSIIRDQRSSSERRDVISDRRFQSDISRLTNRRISITQMIGRSLRPNEGVFATERVNVERRVRKGANKRTYVTEQPEDARRSLQHEKNERQEMFALSSQNALRTNRGRKRDVTVFKEQRQDYISIMEKETSSSAFARLKERSRSTNMKPSSVRNDEHFPWTLHEHHSIWSDVISVSRALLLGAAGVLGTQMLAKEKLF